MKILAIETSCDETAAAVVTDGVAESNVISSQIDVHRTTGGVVPEVAARLQLEVIQPVIDQALRDASTEMKDVDAIAVTAGPGLIGSLMVGLETAKALAYATGKPLIPVNHLAGHLYGALANLQEFTFPYLGLIVSGGHTELVLMDDHHSFTLLGETRDDAAGEAFDKVAKLMGLPYPGGPEISKLATQGNPDAITFPRAMLDQDTFDFSFSGLKTAARREIGEGSPDKARLADIAASFEAAVTDVLIQKTLRAAESYDPEAVLLGGGVAANQKLRNDLTASCETAGLALKISPPEYSTDNAAMIGIAASYAPPGLTGAAARKVTADPSADLAPAT